MPSKDLEGERMLSQDHGESCSDSSSEGLYDDDVAKMVHEVIEEGLGNSPTTVTGSSPGVLEAETLHQRAVRAASLYNGLFNAEHSSELVLGPGPHSVYTASIVFPPDLQKLRKPAHLCRHLHEDDLPGHCLHCGPGAAGGLSLQGECLWHSAELHPAHVHVRSGITFARDKSNVETDYNMVIIRNTLAEVMRLVNVSNPSIGPVDFGTESATCRAACVLAFLVTIVSEFQGMCSFAKFVWLSPTLHSRTIFGVMVLQYLFFIVYMHRNCVLEVAPFSGGPVLRPAYFNTTSSGIFNWELLIGRWRSKNITRRSHWLAGPSNITLCAPNGNAAKVLGCGMPTPWSTGQPAP